MLNTNQFRPLLSALYGLVITVMLMLSLVIALLFLVPAKNSAVAAAGPATATASSAAAKPKMMSADALAGKEIFTNNCAACHNTGSDKLVGPGLKGVRQRTPGDAWLQKWIKNSSALIATGDAYAVKVFNENGQVQMTSFASLTDQQIKQVLDYVDASN